MASPALAPDRILAVFRALQANRATVKRTSASQRISKLEKLREAIQAREPKIREALAKDFRKAATEVDLTELFPVLVEIKDAIKHLHRWMRPQRVDTPMSMLGTASEVLYEPKGCVLIIAPWNYPFQLAIAPVIAAVAAGNTMVLKPSELTPATAAVLQDLIGEVFAENEVAVVQGDAVETQKLLALPFEHFFFTGSTKVGRIVAEAAAKHLASTTLELGGKSPAIVDDSADMKSTARRLVWGKFVNGGQTCIAPDYIMVAEGKQTALVEALRSAITDMYGADAKKSADFCRIINSRNYDRLTGMLDATVKEGGKVEIGGERDAGERYIAPTVVTNVKPESALMAEEIFGPILPILTFKNLDEVAPFITARDKPLALYMFGNDERRIDDVIANTTAGGTSINNTVIHFANQNLPFGGVGPSGLGSYHGYYGFKTFSHERAVLRQGRIDAFKSVYPPYTEKVQKMFKWMKRIFT